MGSMLDKMSFPILSFVGDMVFPSRDMREATTCTKFALRSGFYSDQLVVDSTGRALKVRGARKLRGIGRWHGYNVFFNQRIQVDLEFEGEGVALSLAEVKDRVLRAFRGEQGWDASDDMGTLDAAVRQSTSIAEVARIVTDAYFMTFG